MDAHESSLYPELSPEARRQWFAALPTEPDGEPVPPDQLPPYDDMMAWQRLRDEGRITQRQLLAAWAVHINAVQRQNGRVWTGDGWTDGPARRRAAATATTVQIIVVIVTLALIVLLSQ